MKKSTRISVYFFGFWLLLCLFPVILFGENWIIFFALYNGDFTLKFVEDHISTNVIVMMVITTLINATILALIVKIIGELLSRVTGKLRKR